MPAVANLSSDSSLTQTILTATREQIQLLLGIQDQHLRLIQAEIPVQVTAREDKLTISGATESVAQAAELFSRLLDQIKRHRMLSENDVRELLKGQLAEQATAELTSRELNDKTEPKSEQPEPSKIKISVPIAPRSRGQARYMQAIEQRDLVFCSGPAGSGKTYLAVAMALHCLKAEQVRKIVLVRPAVEAGEKLGFLPGDMLAKVNPFLRPLLDALRDMLDFDQVQRYMEHDVIEIVPLAFMRGRTLNETFMILDEAQNTTKTQMKMFLTRMGTGSKIVVTGDETQNDLPAHIVSGLNDGMYRLKGIPNTACIRLDREDIVRHPLVREIVKAYDETPPKSGANE